MKRAIGIDLGTTNSAVAILDGHGRPVIVPNGEGATTTPSVICFHEGDVLVGAEARELQVIGRWPVAAFFKRMMGNPHFLFHADGVDYTSTELSSLLLHKLKTDAEVAIGEKIGHAVITVPAYFRDIERKATIEAGRTAGLDVLQVINEPTAAAIAYGAGRDRGVAGRFIVYDLGGGTFDVTLLELGEGENRVLGSGGDSQLGGKDWDDKIIEFLADRFSADFGVNPMDDGESLADLRSHAEAAKKRLSSVRATTVSIVHGGRHQRHTLTREQFEDLTGGLLEQTIMLTTKMLGEVALGPTEVDGVLLVGGSTRMPAVRRRLEEEFGSCIRRDINEDEAVALGAGVVAAERLAARTRDASIVTLPGVVQTIDVTSHSLGVIAVSDDGGEYINSIILPKSARIPSEDTRPFRYRTRSDDSNRLEVFVTQGEGETPDAVAYIGKWVVNEIPHQTSGVTVIDLTYRYDRSGTVEVIASARVAGAARRLSVTVEDLPDDLPDRFLEAPRREEPEHLTAYLAIDVSGSMAGEPIRKAREAARSFLRNTDLAHASLGVIAFATRLRTTLRASRNARAIERAIANVWDADVGGGTSAHPFDEAGRLMSGVEGKRYVIVLTDGEWFCKDDPIKAARKCHGSGVDVIAVGFGDANREFLQAIASTREASFHTDMHALASTFSTIAQVLTETGGDADRVRKRLGLLSAT